jgi:hypothetical protein
LGRLKLAAMYLGAIHAFGQAENPDRLAQSAHGLRELVEKLPGYLDLPVPAEGPRLSDKVQALASLWEEVTSYSTWNRDHDWTRPIDDVLRSFLRKAKEFFVWRETERPSARERTAKVLRGLNPTGKALPPPFEGLRVSEWLEI